MSFGKTAMANLLHSGATFGLQLHTGPPGPNGTSNVATDTSRKQIHFASPTGSDPTQCATDGTTTNNGTAALWSPYSGPALYDLLSHYSVWDALGVGAGNFWFGGPLGGFTPFEALASNAADDLETIVAHGLAAGDPVQFLKYPNAAMPGGLNEDQIYYVSSTGLTTIAFRVATTATLTLTGGVVSLTPGAAIALSGDGAVIVQKIALKPASTGDPVSVTSGEIVFYLN